MKLYHKLPRGTYALYAGIILIGIVLDQISKWLIATTFELHESVPILKDVLHLTYVHNKGAAFGMLADQRWIFLVISSVTILAVGAYLFLGHCEGVLNGISLSMIVSGGIGNMIDRTVLGYVVDFIDFTLIDFAVFNIADSFVCVGAALLCISLIGETRRELRAEKGKKK